MRSQLGQFCGSKLFREGCWMSRNFRSMWKRESMDWPDESTGTNLHLQAFMPFPDTLNS